MGGVLAEERVCRRGRAGEGVSAVSFERAMMPLARLLCVPSNISTPAKSAHAPHDSPLLSWILPSSTSSEESTMRTVSLRFFPRQMMVSPRKSPKASRVAGLREATVGERGR